MRPISKHDPIKIIQFMTHHSLSTYKKVGSKAPTHKQVQYESIIKKTPYKKGVVFVSPSKEHLSAGQGYIMTSYESLSEQNRQLTHWTPNTFRGGTYYNFKERIIKGHTKDNLKQINVIGFDIDTKVVDLYAIFNGCEELGLPRPNLLIETPRGFQGFFILETPFFIHAQKNYKALRVAERIANNILQALKKYVPVDMNCAPFGFFRIPNETNIRYFNDQLANTKLLQEWSVQFEKQENKKAFQVVYHSNASAFDATSSEWYRALINATHIESRNLAAGRNNTLLTLAVANYASGKTIEEAFDELDQFNSNLDNPLSIREFNRVIKSAYSGRYAGPKREYVESLLELWTDGQAQFSGNGGWYKFKKPREERVRSHYEERENDIMLYIDTHTSPENPFLRDSLRELANRFGMAVSTLKEVLKRSQRLIKRTIGVGRNAVTMLTTRSMLFRSFLHKRQEQIKHAQLTFAQLMPPTHMIIEHQDIPFMTELLDSFELTYGDLAGSSPPVKLVV